ncbi:MAG: phage tail protein [Weeksellaceae bacterium]
MAGDGIQVQIDADQAIRELRSRLSNKDFAKAAVRSINKGITKSNTLFKRRIASKYNIKQSDLKDSIKLKRASGNRLEGIISGRTNPISLSRFNPDFVRGGSFYSIRSQRNKETGKRSLEQRMKRASNRNSGIVGVSFEIIKGEKKNIPYAFMTSSEGNSGVAKQIFARGKYSSNKFQKGKPRYPIAALKTVAPFGMMTKEDVSEVVAREGQETVKREFERQIELLFRK